MEEEEEGGGKEAEKQKLQVHVNDESWEVVERVVRSSSRGRISKPPSPNSARGALMSTAGVVAAGGLGISLALNENPPALVSAVGGHATVQSELVDPFGHLGLLRALCLGIQSSVKASQPAVVRVGGIQPMVSQASTQQKLRLLVSPKGDVSISPKGRYTRGEPAPLPPVGTCEVTAYACGAFATIRKAFGVDERRYEHAFSALTLSESKSHGRSKAMFFRSETEAMVLAKELKRREARAVRDMLEGYAAHFREHQDSLLCRLLGLYKVKRRDWRLEERISEEEESTTMETLYILVMMDQLGSTSGVNRVFDLKGSTWRGRRLEQKELGGTDGFTLRDLDFLDAQAKIRVKAADRADLLRALRSDLDFLMERQIVDYSLLVGMSRGGKRMEEEEEEEFVERDGPVWLENGCPPAVIQLDGKDGEMYWLALIDWLCDFSVLKKLERISRQVVLRQHDISVQPPREYAQRLMAFVETKVIE